MKNKLEYILFTISGSLFSLIGEKASRKLANALTWIIYHFIPIRKKVVIENLTKAFPHLSEKEIKNLTFRCYRSFVITLIEILRMKNLTEAELISKVVVENPELISENFCKGKGIILLSAHLGNWEYSAASVALQVNIPFHVIVKSQRNPFVDRWMNEVRTKWINKIIPLGISIRNVYAQLKEHHIVAMVADQRGPAEGVKMKFFGRNTSVYTGPAILSLKTGAPLIFGVAVRQTDFTYRIRLHQIDMNDLPENEDEKIFEITRRQIKYLEDVISKHPEQWLWMHKRWKH